MKFSILNVALLWLCSLVGSAIANFTLHTPQDAMVRTTHFTFGGAGMAAAVFLASRRRRP